MASRYTLTTHACSISKPSEDSSDLDFDMLGDEREKEEDSEGRILSQVSTHMVVVVGRIARMAFVCMSRFFLGVVLGSPILELW